MQFKIYTYYYHADHLGSTSSVTDSNGTIIEHLQYLPFGEMRSIREYLEKINNENEQVFIEKRTANFSTPYKFSGKEMDSETGYHYFGARYQDPVKGIFLSVDSLADKYPWISPYAYCLNNPLKFVDPDGRQIKTHREIGKDGKVTIVVTVKGKLVNNSSVNFSYEELQGYASRMSAAIAQIYTGEGETVNYRGVADISVASADNPLTKTDHAFRIMDYGNIPGSEVAFGKGEIGQNVIYLSNSILNNREATDGPYAGTGKTINGGPTLERTFAHELGHSGGIHKHPNANDVRYDWNLMHPTIRPYAGKGILESQIKWIEKNYRGIGTTRLNRGEQQ